jgi:hypothetical protein
VLGSGGEYLEISTFFFRPKNRSGTVRDYTGFQQNFPANHSYVIDMDGRVGVYTRGCEEEAGGDMVWESNIASCCMLEQQ